MIINEIFYSLQGEGALAGVPSVFIRLAGCPLRCKWCDTKYAWPPDSGREHTVGQILSEIEQYPTDHVVVTGGEPITNCELPVLLNGLSDANKHITIETSGIAFVTSLPCDLMSISPKLSNSTPGDPALADEHEESRYNKTALQQLINTYDYQLKFVVDAPTDLDEIAQSIGELENINPYKIYLMPQATTIQEYLSKSQMVAAICKQTGFAMSQRLQVMLWNSQKGK
ncbi:MAG: 7-carboxy-7-deazaguanine synthase QueE [Anaerohalosphaera sp.]|nr:7-carboxy-7-deazaguanine synthase QueE [Anaerohalosphaera sp.]